MKRFKQKYTILDLLKSNAVQAQNTHVGILSELYTKMKVFLR